MFYCGLVLTLLTVVYLANAWPGFRLFVWEGRGLWMITYEVTRNVVVIMLGITGH